MGTPPPVWQVLLYYPNIIGHLRILLLYTMVIYNSHGHHGYAVSCLLASLLLDTVDGAVARRFNQVTNFGRYYDMAIDTLTPQVVFACCSAHKPLAFLFAAVTLVWVVLASAGTEGHSWKTAVQPVLFPAAWFTAPDGSFTWFGTLLYYLGFVYALCVLYFCGNGVAVNSGLRWVAIVAGGLDLLSMLEYVYEYAHAVEQ